jgi:signal transduction histidine kinase
MTFHDFGLICFAAASVIHAIQTVLAAKLHQQELGKQRLAALDGVAIGLTCFVWQSGNFLAGVFSAANFTPTSNYFFAAQFIRSGALVCFPLLFSYMCLHFHYDVPDHRIRVLIGIGRSLRFPLWPWTIWAVAVVAADAFGRPLPGLSADRTNFVTLHIMLLYFVILTAAGVSYRRAVRVAQGTPISRAQIATVLAGAAGVVTFVLMLSGYWKIPVPFMSFVELAAMLTSVPFTISVAYRLFQFPFMDVFIREVISGSMILAVFVATLTVGNSVLWLAASAMVLVFAKAPLTRWVERAFLGYAESVEDQEERIGAAIRGLAALDEFGPRISEILAREVEAQWIDVSSGSRPDAVYRFEISGSNISLFAGPRIGKRRYMSRQLHVLRTAALQLSAHHHQLAQSRMRELAARAQMRALQAQINPHFLFNTLNVLASLIHSDPREAERVTEDLAEIFRYALESTRLEWVTLEDELRFLESYLGIEKTRFGERLIYTIDVDKRLRSARIPPMILQPLVENAVKHGIGSKLEGGEIRITCLEDGNRLSLSVEDTGMGLHNASKHSGAGIGLSNVRERLQHVYGGDATLRLEENFPSGTRVVVTLPLLGEAQGQQRAASNGEAQAQQRAATNNEARR